MNGTVLILSGDAVAIGEVGHGLSVVFLDHIVDLIGGHGDLVQANGLDAAGSGICTVSIVDVNLGVFQLAVDELIGLEGGVGLAIVPVGVISRGVIDEHGAAGNLGSVDIDHVNVVVVIQHVLNLSALKALEVSVTGNILEGALRGLFSLEQNLAVLA